MRKPETWSCAHCFHWEQHGELWPNTGSSACRWLQHKHLPLHAYMNTLQVNTWDILVLHKWRNYSRIPRCTLILIFSPCWIYLSNSSLSLCGRQQLLWDMMLCIVIEKKQSLITPIQKIFSFLKRMQYTCCNNITDNQFLIHGNSAGISRLWLIALCFTLSHQCILFEGICWLSSPSDSGFYPFFHGAIKTKPESAAMLAALSGCS